MGDFLGLGSASKEAVDEAAIKLAPITDKIMSDLAAAVSFAIQTGIDRFAGAKITVTIELPPAKARAANPPPD